MEPPPALNLREKIPPPTSQISQQVLGAGYDPRACCKRWGIFGSPDILGVRSHLGPLGPFWADPQHRRLSPLPMAFSSACCASFIQSSARRSQNTLSSCFKERAATWRASFACFRKSSASSLLKPSREHVTRVHNLLDAVWLMAYSAGSIEAPSPVGQVVLPLARSSTCAAAASHNWASSRNCVRAASEFAMRALSIHS
jgi:hypothetical protein